MIKRDGLSWTVAVVLSLLVHAFILFNAGSLAGNREPQTREREATRISFRPATSQPKALSQEAPPEEAVSEEPVESPELPLETTPPIPDSRAERASEIERGPSAAMPKATAPSAQASVTTDKVSAPAEAVSGTVEDPALIEQAKQEYLHRLMAHIERYKHYPRAARRRRIEGDVSVSFNLQTAGRVRGLTVDGGHEILNRAVQRAVEEALPLPEPPPSLALPWPVDFTMRFSLY